MDRGGFDRRGKRGVSERVVDRVWKAFDHRGKRGVRERVVVERGLVDRDRKGLDQISCKERKVVRQGVCKDG